MQELIDVRSVRAAEGSKMKSVKLKSFYSRLLTCLVACLAVLAIGPASSRALAQNQDQQAPAPQSEAPVQDQPRQDQPQLDQPQQDQPQNAQLSPQQLQELVAPIALYPDALVAQILAASAYPTQIVEAERFLEQSPDLKGQALGAEVDKQDWDPSVKALTQFPSVLANMNKDLSWTSELGDANYNQQADVMSAIQYMRGKAKEAGHLNSTPQQTVTEQGDDIDIQPANPDLVYVPDYDPEFIYGYPVGVWPGFYPWWGVRGPFMSFGVGFGIGPFFGFGWGWHGWGFDWGHRGLLYGGRPYAFRSHSFYDRNAYFHGNYRGGPAFERGDRGMRGYAGARGEGGTRSYGGSERSAAPGGHAGAFGGVSRGGDARGFSSRGRSSFGGGHAGGGGHTGGGGHGGGGHR